MSTCLIPCPRCNTPTSVEHRFCTKCGSEIPATLSLTARSTHEFAVPTVLLGAHGGAGVSMLAQITGCIDGGRFTGEIPTGARLILVARIHGHGLSAVRSTLSSSSEQFSMVVLVADAPGRIPKILRRQAHTISGVLPTVMISWIDNWRYGTPTTDTPAVTKFLDRYQETLNKLPPQPEIISQVAQTRRSRRGTAA